MEAKTIGIMLKPAQQGVAAALTMVLRRAMQDGKDAALAAKQTLICNNPATRHLLDMLPLEMPLPAMQQVEQDASDELLESLTSLAWHCAIAECQPLEVFTRSMECTTHKEIMDSISAKGAEYKRQKRMQQLKEFLAGPEFSVEAAGETVEAIRKLGGTSGIASVAVFFLQLFREAQCDEDPSRPLRWSHLDHLLPGRLHCY